MELKKIPLTLNYLFLWLQIIFEKRISKSHFYVILSYEKLQVFPVSKRKFVNL